MGTQMSQVNDLCMPGDLSRIKKNVKKADCPNGILSCSHPATGACVDATSGGGATPSELADCSNWDPPRGSAGGWAAGGEACAGISGNLVDNGSFETPSLAAVNCNGGHDSTFRGDDHCQYKYLWPHTAEFCSLSCTVDGWEIGAPASQHVVLAENANAPWGGLDSHNGKQFLVLQQSGAYIEQQIAGLRAHAVYELRLKMANRPGYTDGESVVIKLDNHIIGESSHPTDDWSQYGLVFTARAATGTLRIENDTPGDGDCSVFIDEIVVVPIQLGATLPLVNGGFDQDAVVEGSTGAGYNYQLPIGWSGSGTVVVQSGTPAWGGIPSAAGPNYIALQGFGAHVEQVVTLDGGGDPSLSDGNTYVVSFAITDRPGYGEDEFLHVKIDGEVIWESTHPEDGFQQYQAVFTKKPDSTLTAGQGLDAVTLQFENDSPEGDRTIFVDSVSVRAAANGVCDGGYGNCPHALPVILPPSSAEAQPYDFQLISTKMPFVEAEAECERRNRKLASVHSMEENAFIASMHHGEDAALYDGLILGAQDAADGTESAWLWTDGTDMDWNNWGPDEPNNGRTTCDGSETEACGENCGECVPYVPTAQRQHSEVQSDDRVCAPQ
jgi:hypothetical protein